jgi:hypothetical protein
VRNHLRSCIYGTHTKLHEQDYNVYRGNDSTKLVHCKSLDLFH